MKLKKFIYYTIVVLVALAAIMFLLHMWFGLMPWETLGRVLLTLGVIAGVLGLFIIVRNDLNDEERMKKDKFLD